MSNGWAVAEGDSLRPAVPAPSLSSLWVAGGIADATGGDVPSSSLSEGEVAGGAEEGRASCADGISTALNFGAIAAHVVKWWQDDREIGKLWAVRRSAASRAAVKAGSRKRVEQHTSRIGNNAVTPALLALRLWPRDHPRNELKLPRSTGKCMMLNAHRPTDYLLASGVFTANTHSQPALCQRTPETARTVSDVLIAPMPLPTCRHYRRLSQCPPGVHQFGGWLAPVRSGRRYSV